MFRKYDGSSGNSMPPFVHSPGVGVSTKDIPINTLCDNDGGNDHDNNDDVIAVIDSGATVVGSDERELDQGHPIADTETALMNMSAPDQVTMLRSLRRMARVRLEIVAQLVEQRRVLQTAVHALSSSVSSNSTEGRARSLTDDDMFIGGRETQEAATVRHAHGKMYGGVMLGGTCRPVPVVELPHAGQFLVGTRVLVAVNGGGVGIERSGGVLGNSGEGTVLSANSLSSESLRDARGASLGSLNTPLLEGVVAVYKTTKGGSTGVRRRQRRNSGAEAQRGGYTVGTKAAALAASFGLSGPLGEATTRPYLVVLIDGTSQWVSLQNLRWAWAGGAGAISDARRSGDTVAAGGAVSEEVDGGQEEGAEGALGAARGLFKRVKSTVFQRRIKTKGADTGMDTWAREEIEGRAVSKVEKEREDEDSSLRTSDDSSEMSSWDDSTSVEAGASQVRNERQSREEREEETTLRCLRVEEIIRLRPITKSLPGLRQQLAEIRWDTRTACEVLGAKGGMVTLDANGEVGEVGGLGKVEKNRSHRRRSAGVEHESSIREVFETFAVAGVEERATMILARPVLQHFVSVTSTKEEVMRELAAVVCTLHPPHSPSVKMGGGGGRGGRGDIGQGRAVPHPITTLGNGMVELTDSEEGDGDDGDDGEEGGEGGGGEDGNDGGGEGGGEGGRPFSQSAMTALARVDRYIGGMT